MGFLKAIARFISGKLLPRMAYPVLRGPLRGARFVLGSLAGPGGGASVYFGGVEKDQTRFMTRTLKLGQTFFDLGANGGYYTILGARLVGTSGLVFSFEPALDNLGHLQKNVSLNGLTQVRIIPAACSDSLAISLFETGANSALGRLSGEATGGKYKKQRGFHVVPTVTVDAVVKQTGVTPDVMKIDVEGAELAVLKGARRTLASEKPFIFLSVHSPALKASCLKFLRGLGYGFHEVDSMEIFASPRTKK